MVCPSRGRGSTPESQEFFHWVELLLNFSSRRPPFALFSSHSYSRSLCFFLRQLSQYLWVCTYLRLTTISSRSLHLFTLVTAICVASLSAQPRLGFLLLSFNPSSHDMHIHITLFFTLALLSLYFLYFQLSLPYSVQFCTYMSCDIREFQTSTRSIVLAPLMACDHEMAYLSLLASTTTFIPQASTHVPRTARSSCRQTQACRV